jgi:hypothetical protein
MKKFIPTVETVEIRLAPAPLFAQAAFATTGDDPLPDPQTDPGTYPGTPPPPTSGPVGPGTK